MNTDAQISPAMTIRNQLLHDSLKAYVQRAIQVLTQSTSAGAIIMPGMDHEWIRRGDGSYILATPDPNSVYMVSVLHRNQEQLRTTEEYAECSRVLKTDRVTCPQINTWVGVLGFRLPITIDDLLDYALLRTVTKNRRLVFDIDAFEETYLTIEDSFYSEQIELRLVSPLNGFATDQAAIELNEDIRIEKLTDDDIKACLSGGYDIGDRLVAGVVFNVPKYGIVYSLWKQKIIGESAVNEISEDPRDRIERVVTALRVFKAGSLSVAGLVESSRNVFIRARRGYFFPRTRTFSVQIGEYRLDAEEAIRIAPFFRAFSGGARERRFLKIAFNRFSYAAERHRHEDKLIDLLIAAEALLLQDDKELGYKLAQRAAFLISDKAEGREEIFYDMLKAYSVRSQIVHGSEPKLPKRVDGTFMSLSEFVQKVESHLRKALHKAVEVAQDPNAPRSLVDWNHKILSSRT